MITSIKIIRRTTHPICHNQLLTLTTDYKTSLETAFISLRDNLQKFLMRWDRFIDCLRFHMTKQSTHRREKNLRTFCTTKDASVHTILHGLQAHFLSMEHYVKRMLVPYGTILDTSSRPDTSLRERFSFHLFQSIPESSACTIVEIQYRCRPTRLAQADCPGWMVRRKICKLRRPRARSAHIGPLYPAMFDIFLPNL